MVTIVKNRGFKLYFFAVCVTLALFSIKISAETSLGPFVLGENRINFSRGDVQIASTGRSDVMVRADLLFETLQWKRDQDVLLIPEVKISLSLVGAAQDYIIQYQDKSYLFQQTSGGNVSSKVEFYYSLFKNEKVKVFKKGQLAKTMWVELVPQVRERQKNHLIDYSCTGYDINIKGLDDLFASVGCKLQRLGPVGEETASLEIFFSSPNTTLESGSSGPYRFFLSKGNRIKTRLITRLGDRREIEITALIPHRLKRLKTALGFGPYIFQSFHKKADESVTITSPLMIYANFFISPSMSVRAFDAFLYSGSWLNNFGTYFAYDMGSILDNRIKLIPLLGFQHIMMSHEETEQTHSSLILPQGFELSYLHAFSKRGYSLVYGMFFSSGSDSYNYQNMWLRYGKRVFGEINYISYERDEFYSKTWGLSVGIPFFSLF